MSDLLYQHKINTEEEFLDFLKKENVSLEFPIKYPCMILGIKEIQKCYIVYPQDKPIPFELLWPQFIFIYPKPFLKKKSKDYFIYETNNLPKKISNAFENKNNFEINMEYSKFKRKIIDDFNLPSFDFQLLFSDEGVEMNKQWSIAYLEIFIKSNLSGIQGDLILIPKTNTKIHDWFLKHKPQFITEYKI